MLIARTIPVPGGFRGVVERNGLRIVDAIRATRDRNAAARTALALARDAAPHPADCGCSECLRVAAYATCPSAHLLTPADPRFDDAAFDPDAIERCAEAGCVPDPHEFRCTCGHEPHASWCGDPSESWLATHPG